MLIKESQLRHIIRTSIKNVIKEGRFINEDEDDDIEVIDTWNKPDEFDDTIKDEPDEADIEDIDIETEKKPETLTKAQEKRRRAADLIRSILSKQGYKGDRLEREVEKRLDGNSGSDSMRMRPSSYYMGSSDVVRYGGRNLGAIDSGVAYNDDEELYECVKRAVRKVMSENKCLVKEGEQWIGNFARENYDQLVAKATQCNGQCSFSLNGTDFTMTPTQRGFYVTSGAQRVADSLNIQSALMQAWKFSISNMANRQGIDRIIRESINKVLKEKK